MGKSKLIGKGGYGCVFQPSIPCKKDLNKKSKTKKNKTQKVSKIIIKKKDKHSKKEFKMNQIIQKLPNHTKWASTWDELCYPPEYDTMKELSEIDVCLKKRKITEKEYREGVTMLVGEEGGIPFEKKCLELIKKSSFRSVPEFNKVFLKIFGYLKPIFYGILQLKKNNICHFDLSYKNIMFKNEQCYLIDFGLSCKINDKESIYKRINKELSTSRIYIPYPYDLLYSSKNKKLMDNELESFQLGLFRDNHSDYTRVHQDIFNRNDINESLENNLLYVQKDIKTVMLNLDTYSLGILLPVIICDIADHYKIKKQQLLKCFNSVKIQNHLSLFKDMTEYTSKNRIPIEEAYRRFNSLLPKKPTTKKQSYKAIDDGVQKYLFDLE
tara:strand:+ start:862 stop:2007 length:1146 start_codon:yes stop_codon:yes gene_type:complete